MINYVGKNGDGNMSDLLAFSKTCTHCYVCTEIRSLRSRGTNPIDRLKRAIGCSHDGIIVEINDRSKDFQILAQILCF